MKALFILLLSGLSFICEAQYQFTGTITRVIDGDTFWFACKYGSFKVRMAGIDAPELKQKFGKESKAFLARFTNKRAVIKTIQTDKYGRYVAFLFIDNVCINLLCVRYGYAWDYGYFNTDSSYALAQKLAQKENKGLWAFAHVEPWNYRKNNHK